MDFSRTSMTELAAIIARHLGGQGIEVVLVGGLAVEIYSQNLYLTKDIDMVNTNYVAPKQLHQAMAELGFTKKGRVFVSETTDISVEFPTAPLSVGDEFITTTATITLPGGIIPILRVEDVVKDRLVAFIHWQDRQSLVQAVAVMLKHQLTPEAFNYLFKDESAAQSYALLQSLHEAGQTSTNITMHALESFLANLILQAQ